MKALLRLPFSIDEQGRRIIVQELRRLLLADPSIVARQGAIDVEVSDSDDVLALSLWLYARGFTRVNPAEPPPARAARSEIRSAGSRVQDVSGPGFRAPRGRRKL